MAQRLRVIDDADREQARRQRRASNVLSGSGESGLGRRFGDDQHGGAGAAPPEGRSWPA
jgi:hypothetical protein